MAIGSVGVTSAIEAMAVITTAPPLRTMSSASLIIGPLSRPTVSSAESAITPRVRSATNSVASGIDVTKWVAPNWKAFSRFDSTMSTTTMCSAPANRAP